MNNIIGSSINYDAIQGMVWKQDYTIDSMHPTDLSYDIMMNMVREDEKKIMIVEVETYE